MRSPRIKFPTSEGDSYYHLISRTVNGEFLFGRSEKEALLRIMRQVADYCGIDLLTFVIMCNHFHVEVKVFQSVFLSDHELLRRYRVLYPKPTPHQVARLEVIEAQLAENGPEAVAWRTRQLRRMGDISEFMKTVKQRFTIWFNRRHNRFGTLWAERFKSLYLQNRGSGILFNAAYIDLNPVRANLVCDPKDYTYCGYGLALAGDARARRGIMTATVTSTWTAAQAAYRQLLFAIGSHPREHGKVMPFADFEDVVRNGGQIPLATALRQRIPHFTNSGMLGSVEFIEEQLIAHRRNTGLKLVQGARPLPSSTDWHGLHSLHPLRRRRVRGVNSPLGFPSPKRSS